MLANWFGLTNYDASLEHQMAASQRVAKTGIVEILGFEHPTTITLGRRANLEKEVYFPASYLENHNIKVAKIDRGGMATLHSPGQLVIYPIIPLRKFNLGVRDFLCLMECTTKETLAELGIKSFGNEASPGLYTGHGKIGFFGFRIDRGVSRHGISINVSNDLALFNLIKPCGVHDQKLDQTLSYSPKNTLEIFNIWQEMLKSNLAKALTPKTLCD